MNSLRASGVMSSHALRAIEAATSAERKSDGRSWTTPPGTASSRPSPRRRPPRVPARSAEVPAATARPSPDVVTELLPLLPLALLEGTGRVLHLAAEVLDVVVEALPRRLPAHTHRASDGLPRGPRRHRLGGQLRLPGGQQGAEGSRGTERDEGVRVAGRGLPRLDQQGGHLARARIRGTAHVSSFA